MLRPGLQRSLFAALLLLLPSLTLSCGDDGAEPAPATGNNGANGKTDNGGSDFDQKLASANDPIGVWLRERSGVDGQGRLHGDYKSVMFGLAEQQGCGAQSIGMYVISDSLLSGDRPFPRLVTTVCNTDDARADELFMSAPSANPEGTDVEPGDIEMYAWDPGEKRYRFYKALPVSGEEGRIQITIEPGLCQDCHLGPRGLDVRHMRMLPVMNELTSPWPHWNAEPDFRSHSFEINEDVKQAPIYADLTEANGWKSSAARLERVIRNGHTRVAAARLDDRRKKPANLDEAMALLRPLFCDEQINYATEDHASGNIPSGIVVDDGMRNVFRAIQAAGLPWVWANDGRLRLAHTDDTSQLLDLFVVRGSADVEYENRLIALRGLTAWQVLQIRALDWQRPVFSELRCNLWKQGYARFQASPPTINAEDRNLNLMKTLYDGIMTLEVNGQRIPLRASAEDRVIAVPLASDEVMVQLGAALAGGAGVGAACEGGYCEQSLTELGDAIDAHVTAHEQADARAELLAERQRRACFALANFGNVPDIPNTEACR